MKNTWMVGIVSMAMGCQQTDYGLTHEAALELSVDGLVLSEGDDGGPVGYAGMWDMVCAFDPDDGVIGADQTFEGQTVETPTVRDIEFASSELLIIDDYRAWIGTIMEIPAHPSWSGEGLIDAQISSDGLFVLAHTERGCEGLWEPEAPEARRGRQALPDAACGVGVLAFDVSVDVAFVADDGGVLRAAREGVTSLVAPEVSPEALVWAPDLERLFVVGDGELYALTGEGELVWRADIEGTPIDLEVDRDVIYLHTALDEGGLLTALDADGIVLGRRSVPVAGYEIAAGADRLVLALDGEVHTFRLDRARP